MKSMEVEESTEDIVYTVDSGFPFAIKGYSSSASWMDAYNNSVEATYYSLKKMAKYYKNKVKNVSKKSRRAKKETAKFQRLAQEYKVKAEEFFDLNPEYFI